MPKLAIERQFFKELRKLDAPLQDKITETLIKFEAATHTGIHMEKIADARNPLYRSIRIDQFYRGVVLTPEMGEVYTLLTVLPHDDAYMWARRRDLTVNRATGGIEIRDAATIDEALPELTKVAEATSTRLFEGVNDADLTRLGIDETILPLARTITDHAQFDALKPVLPETQWDALAGLASGLTPEQVWSELGAKIVDEPYDTDDLDAAVARSGDRIVLVDGPADLMAIFAHPFALWRIYLHPTQQAVVDTAFRGPARVTGGPGTGKTVVALHRAHRLANQSTGPVLVTTFTSTLTDSLRAGVKLLTNSPEVLDRIDIQHIDKLAHQVFRDKHGAPTMLAEAEEKELWSSIIQRLELPFTEAFLAAEWRNVALAQRVSAASEYLSAKRTGRGRRLGANQKAQVWQAVWEFENSLRDRDQWTHETVCREATRLLAERIDKPYKHIVVDEAQDLSPEQWRLVRAAVPEGADDIFIAGDTHQRIYDSRVSLRDVGIKVIGRSSRLNLNYRTTAEILGWSLQLLHGERIDDMDGQLDSIAGCRSDVHGAPPTTKKFASQNEEVTYVAETVKAWIESGVDPSEIGIATRAKWLGRKVQDALFTRSIPVRMLANSKGSTDSTLVGTMHAMKGLEFRCMAVVGVNAKQVPAAAAVTPADEDQQTHERDMQRERCVLFVACTRAREDLLVTWSEEPSPFLVPLI
ncbi:UvrD-helicase domain-containing protein [Rhodococcus sp. NCIMB 12038]|uniref:UvrD-helicase domain-containing protein n=1 Tax=Rhodococcus sp. NCIMB 12038 TaxID=933800 RepID=UPI000B3C3B00|nr:UvrD-helicase domain-containing protein [Rhodococcus sp. NCIMB 12038]OUS94591.1 DNA helicase [Rhodococcus sp. NCIMB 12038]